MDYDNRMRKTLPTSSSGSDGSVFLSFNRNKTEKENDIYLRTGWQTGVVMNFGQAREVRDHLNNLLDHYGESGESFSATLEATEGPNTQTLEAHTQALLTFADVMEGGSLFDLTQAMQAFATAVEDLKK